MWLLFHLLPSPHPTQPWISTTSFGSKLIDQQHITTSQPTTFPVPLITDNPSIKMAPKGKKVERKEENISLGPQIREGTELSAHIKFRWLPGLEWLTRSRILNRRACFWRCPYLRIFQWYIRPRYRSQVCSNHSNQLQKQIPEIWGHLCCLLWEYFIRGRGWRFVDPLVLFQWTGNHCPCYRRDEG